MINQSAMVSSALLLQRLTLPKISQSHDREHRLYIGSQAQADRDQNDHAASKPIKIRPKKATTTCSAPSKKNLSIHRTAAQRSAPHEDTLA